LEKLETRIENKHAAALADLRREHQLEIQTLQAHWEAKFNDAIDSMEKRLMTEDDIVIRKFGQRKPQQQRYRRLQKRKATKKNRNAGANLATLNNRLQSLERIASALACVDPDKSDKKLLVLEGCNLQILNGRGKTSLTNGLGNIIVGYNEGDQCNLGKTCWRQGSHNLAVGPNHEFKSYGGIVAGQANAIVGKFLSSTDMFVARS